MSAARPVDVLRAALGDELGAGQVAVLLAPPGVGKTAVLVQVAIAALSEHTSVLHVTVGDTVDHVRAHYDQALDALGVAARERRPLLAGRMIHAQTPAGFSVDSLGRYLDILADAGAFRPGLVLVDGLEPDAVRDAAAGLAQLAERLAVPLWVTLRAVGDAIAPEIRAAGTVGVRLTPRDGHVQLSVLRDGAEQPLDLALTSASLLIAASRLGGHAERLDPATVTLFSGGADGAEACFGAQAERWGLTEVNFTFPGHKAARTRCARTLSPRELEAGNVSMADVSQRLSRTYRTEAAVIRKVLQLLWHVVSGAEQLFVIGAIQPDDTVVGGTGWAVELARMWKRDVWVYDLPRAGWYRWDGAAWAEGLPVIETRRVAGTGTRKLDDSGRAAIEALFERSFGEAPRA